MYLPLGARSFGPFNGRVFTISMQRVRLTELRHRGATRYVHTGDADRDSANDVVELSRAQRRCLRPDHLRWYAPIGRIPRRRTAARLLVVQLFGNVLPGYGLFQLGTVWYVAPCGALVPELIPKSQRDIYCGCVPLPAKNFQHLPVRPSPFSERLLAGLAVSSAQRAASRARRSPCSSSAPRRRPSTPAMAPVRTTMTRPAVPS